MDLEGGIFLYLPSHPSIKREKNQLNLSNCATALTVIFCTFYGIVFRVNRVLDIGFTWPSKFPINLWNDVRSIMRIGAYASAYIIIISSSNCYFLRDLWLYGFYDFVNTCMIPFQAVGFFSILNSFQTVPFWQTIAASGGGGIQQSLMHMGVWASNMVAHDWGSVSICYFFSTPLFLAKVVEGSFL